MPAVRHENKRNPAMRWGAARWAARRRRRATSSYPTALQRPPWRQAAGDTSSTSSLVLMAGGDVWSFGYYHDSGYLSHGDKSAPLPTLLSFLLLPIFTIKCPGVVDVRLPYCRTNQRLPAEGALPSVGLLAP